MRWLRHGHLAVLRWMPRGARGARSTVVRSLWPPRTRRRRAVWRLPAAACRHRSIAVPVRRGGACRDPSAEVFGVAKRGGRARRRDGGRRSADRRRDHLGTARSAPTGGTRVRPGASPRAGRGRQAGIAGHPAHASIGGNDSAGTASRGRAARGHAWRVRTDPPPGSRSSPSHPRRRRVDDRRDGGGLCRRARGCGRPRGRPAHGGTRVRRAGSWLYSNGFSTGSVVARGSSSVVDASRGRNDPRKATVGRPSMARFRCKSCLGTGNRPREKALSRPFGGGDPLRRRVWGQRPGQPDEGPLGPTPSVRRRSTSWRPSPDSNPESRASISSSSPSIIPVSTARHASRLRCTSPERRSVPRRRPSTFRRRSTESWSAWSGRSATTMGGAGSGWPDRMH